jgi:ribA/ribD-fused uncharacterized protein
VAIEAAEAVVVEEAVEAEAVSDDAEEKPTEESAVEESAVEESAVEEPAAEDKPKPKKTKKTATKAKTVVEAEPSTDADAEEPVKVKKPRKPRAKKTASPASAALPELDAATLDALDMDGKMALLKDHILTLTLQVAALTARLNSGVSGDEKSTEKKQRKKREPKEKAVCPAAAEGVIRFHTTLKNDYKPLGNSFKNDINIDGVVYPSVEHYYHCSKFLSTDAEYAEKIRNTANPALVKNMGRSKKVATRDDWDAVHLDVMRKALRAKFSQHKELATLLRNTATARLEAESPADAFWGIGADGAGTNQLGLLLAEIRATL